jgi:organic radical activating enzyme
MVHGAPVSRSPTVEWQVCGVCNYDCSYCIQSRATRVGHPSADDVEGFLRFFARLPGAWEIKMTGGEPFAFKGFIERIVPGLCNETPHAVSVLTNLSAPPAILSRFARVTRGRLKVVSASLHLEHATIDEFVAKVRAFRDEIDPAAQLVVNAVLVPGRLDEVKRARAALDAVGLRLYPQIMKVGKGTHRYDDDDRPLVDELVGISPSPRTANTAPSYRGRLCYAGAEYFVLLQNGDGWSCRTSRRFAEGFLGNALDGTLRLDEAPARCSYDICPCSVPANRGMIEGVQA